MNKVIDELDNLTDWTPSGALVEVDTLNELKPYIAGHVASKSLVINFLPLSFGEFAEKFFSPSIDLTLFDELTFSLWSRKKKKQGETFKKTADFVYKIQIGISSSAEEYLVPTHETFDSVTFDVRALTSMDRIRITALHDDGDFLIISHMVASTDEIERDVLFAFRDLFNIKMNNRYPKFLSNAPAPSTAVESKGVVNRGILLGTISGVVDNLSININAPLYLQKNAVVLIDNGVDTETHQIIKDDNRRFTFNSYFDGTKLKFAHTNSNLYLVIPGEVGIHEKDVLLPSATFWGLTGDPVEEQEKESKIRDSMRVNGSVRETPAGQEYNYAILMDCTARHDDILTFTSKVLRDILADEFIFIHGKKYQITFEGSPSYDEPIDEFNQIGHIQWQGSVVIREPDDDNSEILPTGDTTTLTVTVKTQGEQL